MKQCPACKNTYTDASLRYCLADGETLETIGEREEETVVRNSVRVPIPTEEPTIVRSTVPPKTGSSGTIIKIVIAVIVLGALALVALGVAGAFIYSSTGGGNNAMPYPTPTPKPSATPAATPDGEKERLEKELADLQKKLEEQANKTSKTPPAFEGDDLPKARVNSPNDGFLALRSQPDSEKGERLTRIPHGTVVTLENCEKQRTTLAGKQGRWCMVTYSGQTGWVFDAWLQY